MTLNHSPHVEHIITCHFGPPWGHISTPRGPKRPFWGPRGPRRALEVLKRPQCPNLVPTVTDWSNWVGNMDVMCSGTSTGTPGAPKRARFCPRRPLWGPIKFSSEYGHVSRAAQRYALILQHHFDPFEPKCQQSIHQGMLHPYQ